MLGNTHTSEYHSHRVEESSVSLSPNIPAIPEVTLESLLTAVLPDVSSGQDNLNRVCQEAISRGLITETNGNSRWTCLPHDPWSIRLDETIVFRFVALIFDQIRALLLHPQSLVECRVDGNRTPYSERDNSSRPDGYIHLSAPTINGEVREDWANIVMPMEFKKRSDQGSQVDDFKKVTWSMHHSMRNDPTRRFIFGLTIENTTARLWFNDRCDIVVSTSFDINKEWRVLVQIMLGVMRARREELGYDTDIRVVLGSSPRQYDITVRDQTDQASTATVYRTIDVLSTVGAECSFGRGTRVWMVQKLVDGTATGPYYALKDIWVHPDRLVEHELLKKIKRDKEDYAKYFLTPVAAGFVPSDPGRPDEFDDIWQVIRRGHALELTGKALWIHFLVNTPLYASRSASEEAQEGSGSNRSSVGSNPGDVEASYEPELCGSRRLSQHSRRHYRIVFEEIGTPMHAIRNYAYLISAIEGGCKGLYALHSMGLVHRDVSACNILLVRDDDASDPRGVIMDLEYAKEISDKSGPHDVKTGTAAFMSVEVARMRYLYAPRKRTRATNKTPPAAPPPFRHNSLHDSESLWWVCMWLVFYLLSPGEQKPEHHSNFWKVFGSQDSRTLFWTAEYQFDDLTSHCNPELVEIMDAWRNELTAAYAKSYAAGDFVKVKPELLAQVHRNEQYMLKELLKIVADYPNELQSLSDLTPLPTPSLNSISESVNTPDIVILRPQKLAFDGVVIPKPKKRYQTTQDPSQTAGMGK